MEDSLEDFIRICRNTKDDPVDVQKQGLITAQIKKECDAKAMQILQFAIEGKLHADVLLKCLPFINQGHYQDIVEERAVTKLCGYPLCAKKIPEMPKKQFYISTKNNMVYDITDRKNYCSNCCYRASVHIKSQIETSPLWLRKQHERPRYNLLQKSEKGLPGEVIVQGLIKPNIEPSFTSVSDFAKFSLDEAEEFELNPQEETKAPVKKPFKFKKTHMKTIQEEDQTEQETKDPGRKVKEEPRTNINIAEQKPNVKPMQTRDELSVEAHLKQCFKSWFTLETYIFIYGDETVKARLDSDKLSAYFNNLKVSELQMEQQKRYVEICRRLHIKELAEDRLDSAILGNVLRPIPDYHKLRAENKEIDGKVKAFYGGDFHVMEATQSRRDEGEDSAPAVLPLVDKNSQVLLRRKIFLTSLTRTVENQCRVLRITASHFLPEIQGLVKTFRLQADNIVFKPNIWTYIAIFLLKILTLKNDNLRSVLEEERISTQIQLWLSSCPNAEELFQYVADTLSDIDSYVENYINCV